MTIRISPSTGLIVWHSRMRSVEITFQTLMKLPFKMCRSVHSSPVMKTHWNWKGLTILWSRRIVKNLPPFGFLKKCHIISQKEIYIWSSASKHAQPAFDISYRDPTEQIKLAPDHLLTAPSFSLWIFQLIIHSERRSRGLVDFFKHFSVTLLGVKFHLPA